MPRPRLCTVVAAVLLVSLLENLVGCTTIRYAIPAGDPVGIITTYAGNGVFGDTGDGGPAVQAEVGACYQIALDDVGNLYIPDCNAVVRKVTPAGIITTVAGNGVPGYGGDGGPATSAELNVPNGVAVDSAGNLYIADLNNNVVRKVDTSGTITTVAGNTFMGFKGDGGPATSARLNTPDGVAVDLLGNVYIADYGNNRVRKVSPAGIITTVAGSSGVGFGGDGGPATAAMLDGPIGVGVDNTGDFYIADSGNMRIRRVSQSGVISTFAGSGSYGTYSCGTFLGDEGPAVAADLCLPTSVTVAPSGSVYIADNGYNRIRIVAPSGIISTVAGDGVCGFSGDGGAALEAKLCSPTGIAVDRIGSLYIDDLGNNRIRKVTY